MSNTMEFDGERFTPECEREIWYEHLHRYALASTWCKSRRVLDAACGEGYGSALIASQADHVTGLDISASAIDHAKTRYQELGNLEFRTGDVSGLPFEDDVFDVIVSFETLEHLEAQKDMLREFRRVLRADGFLVLSSPDKAEYSDRRGFRNKHHVRELYRDELEALLSVEFGAYRILGQKLLFHSAIWSMDEINGVETQTWSSDATVLSGRIEHAPMYFLALCAAAPEYLPESNAGLWLFDDAEESVYRHYNSEIQRVMTAGKLLAERDQEIKELQQARSRPWWQRLFGKS